MRQLTAGLLTSEADQERVRDHRSCLLITSTLLISFKSISKSPLDRKLLFTILITWNRNNKPWIIRGSAEKLKKTWTERKLNWAERFIVLRYGCCSDKLAIKKVTGLEVGSNRTSCTLHTGRTFTLFTVQIPSSIPSLHDIYEERQRQMSPPMGSPVKIPTQEWVRERLKIKDQRSEMKDQRYAEVNSEYGLVRYSVEIFFNSNPVFIVFSRVGNSETKCRVQEILKIRDQRSASLPETARRSVTGRRSWQERSKRSWASSSIRSWAAMIYRVIFNANVNLVSRGLECSVVVD